jgi:hypothetical protein
MGLMLVISPAGMALDAARKEQIGRKIWQNECGGSVGGLTTWNAGEEFPSLGIGHFIWYPAGFKGRFDESWPSFVGFAKSKGAKLPEVALERHSPWTSKAQFQREFDGARLSSLRKWLAGNITLQTDFIIARSRAALPKILDAAPASEKKRIEANYHKVATTPQGTYALIDYVNFKGDGCSKAERYNGRGWGLLQVLGEMRKTHRQLPTRTRRKTLGTRLAQSLRYLRKAAVREGLGEVPANFVARHFHVTTWAWFFD